MQSDGRPDVFPLFSRVSSPQKLASPTFQVPPWRTATPDWLDRAGEPPIRIEYLTVAWLDDHTIATAGPSGEEISTDGGVHWKPNSKLNLNALAALNRHDAWAVGASGTISRFSLEAH